MLSIFWTTTVGHSTKELTGTASKSTSNRPKKALYNGSGEKLDLGMIKVQDSKLMLSTGTLQREVILS